MLGALRILITDPRWFCTVYRFYRDAPWSAEDPSRTGARRALWKIFCDNG
jgi:hypothetical protein